MIFLLSFGHEYSMMSVLDYKNLPSGTCALRPISITRLEKACLNYGKSEHELFDRVECQLFLKESRNHIQNHDIFFPLVQCNNEITTPLLEVTSITSM